MELLLKALLQKEPLSGMIQGAEMLVQVQLLPPGVAEEQTTVGMPETVEIITVMTGLITMFVTGEIRIHTIRIPGAIPVTT